MSVKLVLGMLTHGGLAMDVIRYSSEHIAIWNEHISHSRLPHFMFYREYIEYHSDRFTDHSLIFKNEKGLTVAVFPANEDGSTLYSHQGLSFGGLILLRSATASDVFEIFESFKSWVTETQRFKRIIYKRVPDIYSVQPNQEDLYFLNQIGGRLFRCDLSTAINLRDPLPMQKQRERLAKKAIKSDVVINKSNPSKVWPIIEVVLKSQHNTKPAHSCDEMKKLASAFPENISCWSAEVSNEVIACVVVYITEKVVHAQYIANSDQGREIGALDLLFKELIENQYMDLDYFDFGISTEDQGRILNEGLIRQKQGFGGRGISHEFYEVVF